MSRNLIFYLIVESRIYFSITIVFEKNEDDEKKISIPILWYCDFNKGTIFPRYFCIYIKRETCIWRRFHRFFDKQKWQV